MSRRLGLASDYYRLRVSRIDASSALDLEWRDDILYRRPPKARIEESDSWRVEAVNLEDDSDVRVLETFETEAAAYDWFAAVSEELVECSISEFDARYVDVARPEHHTS